MAKFKVKLEWKEVMEKFVEVEAENREKAVKEVQNNARTLCEDGKLKKKISWRIVLGRD